MRRTFLIINFLMIVGIIFEHASANRSPGTVNPTNQVAQVSLPSQATVQAQTPLPQVSSPVSQPVQVQSPAEVTAIQAPVVPEPLAPSSVQSQPQPPPQAQKPDSTPVNVEVATVNSSPQTETANKKGSSWFSHIFHGFKVSVASTSKVSID